MSTQRQPPPSPLPMPSPRLGAFARLGQYITGSTGTASPPATNTNRQLFAPPPPPPDHLVFKTDAALTAMSADPASNHAVIAGRGYMRVVRVEPTQICEAQDMLYGDPRGGYVSDLKWLIGPHSKTIALASTNGLITLHDVEKPEAVRQLASGHSRTVNSLSVNPFNPHILISGGQDGTVRYWDLRTLLNVATVKGVDASRRVQFSSVDGSRFCTIYESGTLARYDARNLSIPDRRVTAHTGAGLCLDYHPTMDVVITGGRDRAMRVWDLRQEPTTKQTPSYEIYTSGAISSAIWRKPLVHEKINEITDLPVACASLAVGDYRLHVFNLRRRYVPERVIDTHTGPVMGLAWAGDGPFGSGAPLEEDSDSSSSESEYVFSPATSGTSTHPPLRTTKRTKRKRRQRGVLWACSRDMTFRAHDVRRACPCRPVHNLSHQAFAWGPDDDFTFIGFDKRKLRHDGLIDVPITQASPATKSPSEEDSSTPMTTSTSPVASVVSGGLWGRRNSAAAQRKSSMSGATPSSVASSSSSTGSGSSMMMRMLLSTRRTPVATVPCVPRQDAVSGDLSLFKSGLDTPGIITRPGNGFEGIVDQEEEDEHDTDNNHEHHNNSNHNTATTSNTNNNNNNREGVQARFVERQIEGVQQDGIGFQMTGNGEQPRQVRSV
ncbi:WD40-repeat-containing domain protein [Myxozyma melibiosi]|uniref:WD40-repeat-containing domain protein n=1 Tax=Myxozyma melibiosi TaxID=54550 RepID=A0ABR1F264_9ASCO